MSEGKRRDEILNDTTNLHQIKLKPKYSPTKDKPITRIRLKITKEVSKYPSNITPIIKITF